MSATAMASQAGLMDMILGAGLMVKFVLLALLVFSVVSWAIITYKLLILRKAERETAAYLEMFWRKKQFSQIYSSNSDFNATPLAAIFASVYSELSATVKLVPSSTDGPPVPDIRMEDMDRIKRVLRKSTATELARFESKVGFLATTGNAAPFIGLFGTVWGIMTSFRDIGAKGAANIAVVAPGISEALVATAMGLLAAIPAVIGYNHIVSRTDALAVEMENFCSDILNIVEKQIPK